MGSEPSHSTPADIEMYTAGGSSGDVDMTHHRLLLGLNPLRQGSHLPLELRGGGQVAQQTLQGLAGLVAEEQVQLTLGPGVLRLHPHLFRKPM